MRETLVVHQLWFEGCADLKDSLTVTDPSPFLDAISEWNCGGKKMGWQKNGNQACNQIDLS